MSTPPFHALIIGYVWPEPRSSAAGLRSASLIRIFQEQGWKVSFASPARENEHSRKIADEGVHVYPVDANDSRFDETLQEIRPDFVVFDRFMIEEMFGWRVRAQCPEAVRILDTEDLHSLRRAREESVRTGKPLDLRTEDAVREIASIYRSDLTLIISDFELELLQTEFGVPKDLLLLSQFSYPDPPTTRLGFEERQHFCTIGNFRHPPNADGVRWLREKIWPGIRKHLPRAEVHVFGAYPPKEFMEMTKPEIGFHVKGPAKDQYETLERYRVNLAPLRFGAGIKGKISDGWWVGTPAVSTPIGSEGMSRGEAWGGTVAANEEEFIAAAIELHENRALWQAAQHEGDRLMRELFLHSKNAPALVQALVRAHRERDARRRANFVGEILWHQSHRSTEFFSRWIEEKNRKLVP